MIDDLDRLRIKAYDLSAKAMGVSKGTPIVPSGWLVATYVTSGSPLVWVDAAGGIAAGKIGLVNALYHTLGNDSHGSNNADKMVNRYGNVALQIEAVDVGTMDTLGTNNAFTYIEKINLPAGASGYTRHWESGSKGWYTSHQVGAKATFGCYLDGSTLKTVSHTVNNIASGSYFFNVCSYIAGTGTIATYDATGTLIETKSASWLGTYQVPSAVWRFETNGADNHYCSHFGYINRVASATDISNFVTWANTV